MIGFLFAVILFFVAIFFLFKGVLVTAAGIMAFSVVWYLVGMIQYKHDTMINYISTHKGGNS